MKNAYLVIARPSGGSYWVPWAWTGNGQLQAVSTGATVDVGEMARAAEMSATKAIIRISPPTHGAGDNTLIHSRD